MSSVSGAAHKSVHTLGGSIDTMAEKLQLRRARLGLDHIRFHDLRHTTATLLLIMGTHPKIVQELLGHSRISMTLDLYSHVIPPLQEEAMQRFSSYLTPQ